MAPKTVVSKSVKHHVSKRQDAAVPVAQSLRRKTYLQSFEVPNKPNSNHVHSQKFGAQNSELGHESIAFSGLSSNLGRRPSHKSSIITSGTNQLKPSNQSKIQQDFYSVISNESGERKKINTSYKQSDSDKNWSKTQREVENRRKYFAENPEEKEHKRRRRRAGWICAKCSPCCCIVSALIGALLLMGLIAAIVAAVLLSKNNKTSTSTTTTTTSTSSTSTTTTTSTTSTSTSTTSTTATTTTTTTTTSTTTFSTTTSTTSTTTSSSTSTSTTTSTGTTSTSSTSTSTTTSTATTSTSITSTSTTTSTETTSTSSTSESTTESSTSTTSVTTETTTFDTTSTTTLTSTTTQVPPCPPTSVGGLMTLWTTNSPTTTNYTCQAYSWTAAASGTVSLQFQLQHSPGRWYLDDVSVFHGGTQLLVNGGFENGVLAPWYRTTPMGSSCGGQQGDVSNSAGRARTGTWFLWDGTVNCYDQIQQVFNVTAGETYVISYWIKSTTTSGSPIFAKVLIS